MNEIAKQAADLYEQGKKEAAVITLTTALNTDFEQLDLILQLSTYLIYGGELDQAEELLQRSLSIYPDNTAIKYNLGNVYYSQSEFVKAMSIFAELRDNNAATFMLAQCYQQLGDNKHALVYAITASEKETQDETYAQLVGDILLSMGNLTQARDYYQASIKIKKNEKNTFNLALCLSVLDESGAQAYFEESKQINQKYYEDNIQRLADIQKLINGNQ